MCVTCALPRVDKTHVREHLLELFTSDFSTVEHLQSNLVNFISDTSDFLHYDKVRHSAKNRPEHNHLNLVLESRQRPPDDLPDRRKASCDSSRKDLAIFRDYAEPLDLGGKVTAAKSGGSGSQLGKQPHTAHKLP